MIGERLATLRKNKKMRQEELAQILGLTKHSISLYENNKSSPSDSCYVLLAKTFQVSIDYLMGLVDEPYPYERGEQNIIRLPKKMPDEAKSILSEFISFLQTKYDE